MADIVIMGMNMPKNCLECIHVVWNGEDDVCRFSGISALNIGRQVGCPLIELSPHGRLIDADALLADVRAHSDSYFADDFAHEWVDVAPTVIPADKDGEE